MRIISLLVLLLNTVAIGRSHSDYCYQKMPVGKIIIINSLDASELPARKKKKELFAQLADSLIRVLHARVSAKYGAEVVVFPGILPRNDSAIATAMAQYGAVNAIILESMDVFFHQTKVEVEKDEDGKSRTAFYDLCSYTLFKVVSNSQRKHVDTKDCEYFTERSVVSGLFAGGPDIVGKSKYAFGTIDKHVEKFLIDLKEKGLIR